MISFGKNLYSSALLDFDSQVFQEIRRNADILNLDEGATFLFPNKVQTSLYFVQQGVLRSYTKHHDKDVTRWFYGKNEMALSFQGFLYDLPSDIYLQALTSSFLIEIPKDYYNFLCLEYPAFKHWVDHLNGQYLINYQSYTDRLKTLSALERYECFVEEYPEINLRVQVQHIATFLGITPDTLTKIRKRYKKH